MVGEIQSRIGKMSDIVGFNGAMQVVNVRFKGGILLKIKSLQIY